MLNKLTRILQLSCCHSLLLFRNTNIIKFNTNLNKINYSSLLEWQNRIKAANKINEPTKRSAITFVCTDAEVHC